MNEHSFIRSFHKRLDPRIGVWKIHDPFQGGVPDTLLFGLNGLATFIEYKYIHFLPKRNKTIIKPGLTEQQCLWINDKITRGLSAVVILGSKDGVVIFTTPDQWTNGIPRQDADIYTPKQAAALINARLISIGAVSYDAALEIQSVSTGAGNNSGSQS